MVDKILNYAGKITAHFSRYEFRSQYDNVAYPAEWIETKLKPLCENLEVLREALGNKTIKVTSGYRSPYNNARVGGVKNSFHLQGLASDIYVEGVSPSKVADKIEELIAAGKMQQGGLGRYYGFTHYDIRGYKARWNG